jgi:MFS family permease
MLYPPVWRERYGEEVRALLEEAGSSPAAAASLAVRAVPAWVNPPRHLHDREARMRASVGTVLVAWSALTGAGIVFVQLTQLQGFRAPGHPLVQWCYLVFDAALAVSVLTAAAGGVPLWLQMIRLAGRQRRRRELAWLSLAVAVPALYMAAALIALTVVRDPEASGPWWFIGFAILGFAAAGLASAGPAVAMNRLTPDGPAVVLAAAAAGVAAATVALAGLASAIAALGLCLWATSFAGYHHAGLAAAYLLIVVAVAATATISAGRGIRATFATPGH